MSSSLFADNLPLILQEADVETDNCTTGIEYHLTGVTQLNNR